MYQHNLDPIALAAKEWRFMRGDDSVIADRVKLRSDGIIEGHFHANEVGWAVVEDAIAFLDSDGKVSTAFNNMTKHIENGQIVGLTLSGYFRQTSGSHILQERSLEEVADHDPAAVDRAIEIIRNVPAHLMRNASYLEHELIPSLGLNNEMLHEQPRELSAHYGKGLFLWQYPSQFSRYLAWLVDQATVIERFAEIGSRWGGTFIVVCEWLKRVSPQFTKALAIDPIAPSPFIGRYLELVKGEGVEVSYLQDFSTSESCRDQISKFAPDMVFVDGDHDVRSALADHLLARETAKIIVHHDIASDACRDTVLVWQAVRTMDNAFVAEAFVDQYQSVSGSFLGIGCLRRVVNPI